MCIRDSTEAVDYVVITVLQVGTLFLLSRTRNLLQYRDVRLQETTHDGYMCDGVRVCARFILVGLSVHVAFYMFARARVRGHLGT